MIRSGLGAWGRMGWVGLALLGGARGQEVEPPPVVPPALQEEDVLAPPPPGPRLTVGLETWFTRGGGDWEISFSGFDPGLGLFTGRSRLEWRRLDSLIVRIQAEYEVSPEFRLAGSLGVGGIDGGQNRDTDWLGLFGGPEFLFFQSEADTTGDVTMVHLEGRIRLPPRIGGRAVPGTWDLVAGYQFYEDDLRDRNGVLRIDFGSPTAEPIPGLDSTYTFQWHAVRLGVRGGLPLGAGWTARVSAILLAGAAYRGEAFWNLREDFRSTTPNFVHRAYMGLGADLRVSVRRDLPRNLFAEAGFEHFTIQARDGTDTTFFADGDSGSARLDKVQSERTGFFLGFGGRF